MRGWLVSPVIGSGTDEDPFRPRIADRTHANGDRLEFVIDAERSNLALVGYDLADDSDVDGFGERLLSEAELDKAADKAAQSGRLKALAARQKTGQAGNGRDVLRRIGKTISPTFDERLHLGDGKAPPTGSFLVDAFTGTSTLAAHGPETGGKWEGAEGFNLEGGLLLTAGVNNYGAYNAAEPAGTEYDIEAVYLKKSISRDSFIVQARKQGATDTAYITGWDFSTTAWQLAKRVAGAETLLGEWVEAVPGAAPKTVTSIRDATKKLYVDGVERISSTDNSIVAKGFVGVAAQNVGNPTAGIKLDSLTATNAVEGPTARSRRGMVV